MEPLTMIAAGSAIAGLAGSLFGSSKAARERKKMNRYLDQQEADNKAWYNANALGDYTQRSDVQALMGQLRNSLVKKNKAAANTAVVTGATTEQQAVEKEQSNKVLADAWSQMGAMGQQWKDKVTDRYLARKQELAGQRMGVAQSAAQGGENLMSNGLGMAGNIFGSYLAGSMGKS